MPTALITGIAGQDGSYLAELLLEKGYTVCGVTKGPETGLDRLAPTAHRLVLHATDLRTQSALEALIEKCAPDEIYHLAAESFMPAYAGDPAGAMEDSALGSLRLLEAVRRVRPQARFCLAGSSEMFGRAAESPQTERTPFAPRNLYGIAKVFAHSCAALYREQHGLFTGTAFLFNHESPRRNVSFVTRKITSTAARIKLGLAQELRLGNLDARRDWGFAGDYARAMWLMLQQDRPDDYVIATGKTHSVRELCELAFARVGLDYRSYVVQDPAQVRTNDYEPVGDAAKARNVLGWQPQISFAELVNMMVDADLDSLTAPNRI